MTDRHAGYVVILEHDIRKDDAEVILSALKQIRGVLSVEPVTAGIDQCIADSRAKHSMRMKLYEFLENWKP
jgi:hypothetical protein